VVVLWMGGGMAQTETFDPKRYTPFAPGVRIDQVLSTFPAIDTAVDDIKFTKGLEQIGSVMDRGAVIRGFTAADLGFILHSRHQYHRHPRYTPPQPIGLPPPRSRLHPAPPTPVPLAHRLHPAAADGDAAPRRDDLAHARTAQSRH